MQINLMEPENLKKLFEEMDIDCKIRVALSVLSGRKRFVEQLSIECGIMNTRDKEKESIEL